MPPGEDAMDVQTALNNNNWTSVTNPNGSSLVNITTDVDVFVKFTPYQPGAAIEGHPIWRGTSLTEQANKWFGYSRSATQINNGIGIWVRVMNPGETGTVYNHFRRE